MKAMATLAWESREWFGLIRIKSVSSFNQIVGEQLTAGADAADRANVWPTSSWSALRDNGFLRSSIPAEYGGAGLSAVEQLRESEAIAGCCLTTAFILSQREAAVRRVLNGPAILKDHYLPRSAAGEEIITIGLSQLTTSRQHGRPALVAVPLGNGDYRLDGEIPWVTAADRAAAIVGGAVDEAGSQLLFMLPTDRPGVAIEPPLDLAALAGSRTSLVKCREVLLRADEILTAPSDRILGAAGGGGLETSCLALGLAGAALDFLRSESRRRVEVGESLQALSPVHDSLRQRLHEAAEAAPNLERALQIRSDCTLFTLRVTQLALLTAKGTGFVAPHPAQRWARQAHFFLVWSCPRSVADEVRGHLLGSARI
jgi:butyryl-CoA dehydrogenase